MTLETRILGIPHFRLSTVEKEANYDLQLPGVIDSPQLRDTSTKEGRVFRLRELSPRSSLISNAA